MSSWEVFWARLTGDKNVHEQPPGSTQPSLYDGQCALEDYDCDGIANYLDPDWTDGPGEDGNGDPLCELF